jgi:hypothetical protein
MRFLWTFPIAFVAGIHGFAMFAPYLIAVMWVGLVLRNRKAKVAPVPVRVPVVSSGVCPTEPLLALPTPH